MNLLFMTNYEFLFAVKMQRIDFTIKSILTSILNMFARDLFFSIDFFKLKLKQTGGVNTILFNHTYNKITFKNTKSCFLE